MTVGDIYGENISKILPKNVIASSFAKVKNKEKQGLQDIDIAKSLICAFAINIG